MIEDGRWQGRLGARLRYQFDAVISAGPVLPPVGIAILLLVILGVGAVRLAPLGPVASLLPVALGGVLVVAAIVALLSGAIAARRAELRQGRSAVVETGHVLILNWSPAIFDLVAELARPSRKRSRIVILAPLDKLAMEDALAQRLGRLGKIGIICRSGDPTDPGDLQRVSPATAHAIVIVSPAGPDPDLDVVKTVLALASDPRRAASCQVAVQIRDRRNAELVRAAGGTAVRPVLADALLAHVAVHAARQPGLAAVYAGLLEIAGSHLHTIAQPPIEAMSFGDALMAYDRATLLGLCDTEGRVYLNPPMETQVRPGLKAVLLAGTPMAAAAGPGTVDQAAIALPQRHERQAERTLLLGWNHRGPAMVYELSRRVAPGSLLTIAADTPELPRQVAALLVAGSNLQVEFGIADVTHRPTLEGLDILSYNHVLLLGDAGRLAAQAIDTRTLVTLLHLHGLAAAAVGHPNVVAEMIDGRNSALATGARPDDVVISDRLVALLLARAVENESLSAVVEDLLDEQGSELCLRPAGDYLELGRPITFYTVTEACRRRGEVAIGHLRPTSGITLNPPKSEALTYTAADRLIVLARD